MGTLGFYLFCIVFVTHNNEKATLRKGVGVYSPGLDCVLAENKEQFVNY